MGDTKKIVAEMKQKRDELEVQVKLGSMEAKDEWEKLEAKWNEFSRKAELSDTAEGVGDALEKLGGELKSGYDRLKKAL